MITTFLILLLYSISLNPLYAIMHHEWMKFIITLNINVQSNDPSNWILASYSKLSCLSVSLLPAFWLGTKILFVYNSNYKIWTKFYKWKNYLVHEKSFSLLCITLNVIRYNRYRVSIKDIQYNFFYRRTNY
jgi:hypothetical protein